MYSVLMPWLELLFEHCFIQHLPPFHQSLFPFAILPRIGYNKSHEAIVHGLFPRHRVCVHCFPFLGHISLYSSK